MYCHITPKIKDLSVLNKIIWIACPDRRSAVAWDISFTHLLRFLPATHPGPCISDYKCFFNTFTSFIFSSFATKTAWFWNTTESRRTLVSTSHHDRICPEISFLQSYLTIPGISFTRSLDYISLLETNHQICNFGENLQEIQIQLGQSFCGDLILFSF